MDSYTQADFSSIALITVDVQRDFLDGQAFAIPGTSAILPNLQRLLATFRQAGRPIVHMVRLYQRDGSNVDLCRRRLIEEGKRIVRPGTSGCELAGDLLPKPALRLDANRLLSGGVQLLGPNEVVIYKPRWGAFFNTPLEQRLRELKVSSLAITGCNFPNCPRATIYEASERDFRIVLVEDAVSGLYARAKKDLRNIGASLMRARELEGKLTQG